MATPRKRIADDDYLDRLVENIVRQEMSEGAAATKPVRAPPLAFTRLQQRIAAARARAIAQRRARQHKRLEKLD